MEEIEGKAARAGLQAAQRLTSRATPKATRRTTPGATQRTTIRVALRVAARAAGFALHTAARSWRRSVSTRVGGTAIERALPQALHAPRLEDDMRAWSALELYRFGVRLHVDEQMAANGSSVLDAMQPGDAQGRGRLVVANHRSPIDIGILLKLFGGRFVARHDLAAWSVVGAAARHAGAIFVDRDDRSSGLVALRRIRRCLERGETVHLFPEGRVVEGDRVGPLAPGGLAALQGVDADLLPVGLAYPPGLEFTEASFAAYVLRVARCRRIPVGVAVGAPIRLESEVPAGTAGRSARLEAEREHLRATLQQLVDRARALVPQ